MRISQLFVPVAACLTLLICLPAQAAKRHHPGHSAAAVPSSDAVELGILAPPAPALSTLEQSYGDAAIARSRYQRRYDTRALAVDAEANGPAPYPCDPRSARASGYVCHNVPGAIGYGQTYAFTPSFVSSPQTTGQDLAEQTSMLPPVTAFFYAVNGLRYDPHN